MSNLNGFELIDEQFIEELNSNTKLLRHRKTGALLLSVENDDENKCFGITFRTPPTDSTGVPHIMEHSVLGGSRKYRVKEPFVELLKGSFKTFLNAMTFSDMTAYPVASTNEKDFYNLVDVYLDAVFHPLIEPHHLEQEGWHYEIEQPEDPLIYKGVVFNEMKGSYSSPERVMYTVTQTELFPDNAYRHDSGGDPRAIPDLTYEQFRTFHETYYHPSNAFIYFYGDDDLDNRLSILNEYLNNFEAQPVDADVDLQAPFSEPRQATYPYIVEPDSDISKKGMTVVNWALPEQTEPEMWMALSVLSYALMGTQASPLRKALIDSGLGEDTMGGGFYQQMRQPLFSAGLRGIRVEDAPQVEALVLDTLQKIADEGIEPEMIEAALNRIEFSLRENNTGSFPRGLSLMFRSVSAWNYRHDPLTPLKYEAPLAAVKEKATSDSDYLTQLVRDFLLDNTHRVTVTLKPDPELQQKQEAEEKARLTAVKQKLSPADINSLIERTKELRAIQSAHDDPAELAKIPRLSLSDLDPTIRTIPTTIQSVEMAELLHHDLFTNGIVYLDLALNFHTLPQELLPYINLFARSLTEIGTEKDDFVKLSQRIDRQTGGIYATTSISHKTRTPEANAHLIVRGKSTVEQTADLLAILQDILLTVNLDNRDRFRQMVLKSKARMEAGLVPSGHSVVNTRLSSYFSESGWASEQTSGVSYLFFLRELAEAIENDWPSVLSKLEAIRKTVINQQRMVCNVTLDGDNFSSFVPQLEQFIRAVPTVEPLARRWHWEETAVSEGLTIPAQVNYVGKAANLYDHGYEYHGSVEVIRGFLRTTWLWEKIRVMGGAYGAFSTFNRHSGVWSYLSYRDPNLLGSLENYDGTAAFLRQGINQDELTKSIIGTISSLDGYQLPDAKGFSALMYYLRGITDEERQILRDQVLGTTVHDFTRFADMLDSVRAHGIVSVLGSSDAIRQANEKMGGEWLKITKLL